MEITILLLRHPAGQAVTGARSDQELAGENASDTVDAKFPCSRHFATQYGDLLANIGNDNRLLAVSSPTDPSIQQ